MLCEQKTVAGAIRIREHPQICMLFLYSSPGWVTPCRDTKDNLLLDENLK
jgi:hypothetical protein